LNEGSTLEGKVVRAIIGRALQVLAGVSAFLLAVLMFLGTADVVARYVFNSPIRGTLELSQVMMAGTVLLAWGYTQQRGDHVRADIVIRRYPARAYAVVYALVLALSLAFFVGLTYQSLVIAVGHLGEGRRFSTLRVSTAPFYFFVPVGGFSMCLSLLTQLYDACRRIVHGGGDK
jgi:TRAP-type transport system small permease protein